MALRKKMWLPDLDWILGLRKDVNGITCWGTYKDRPYACFTWIEGGHIECIRCKEYTNRRKP